MHSFNVKFQSICFSVLQSMAGHSVSDYTNSVMVKSLSQSCLLKLHLGSVFNSLSNVHVDTHNSIIYQSVDF